MINVKQFDIVKLSSIFINALHGDDDVLIEEYLLAFEEIHKFFQLMGATFGFVSSDVRAKLDIIYSLKQEDGSGEYFFSIKNMIKHEMEFSLLYDKQYVSGSRTILRLHRGLEFMYEFLTRLAMLNENAKCGVCCKEAYNNTLAKYHPWLIRKGAILAMYALPTQSDLLKRVCDEERRSIEMLPEMLTNMRQVYDRTHQLYTIYELHELP